MSRSPSVEADVRPSLAGESIFNQAARVFDGWTDPQTGARVLRVRALGGEVAVDSKSPDLATHYHQTRSFLDGGRRMLLSAPQAGRSVLLDLTTGQTSWPFPDGWGVIEVIDHAGTALLSRHEDGEHCLMVWDVARGCEIHSHRWKREGWRSSGAILLSDGVRIVRGELTGKPHHEPASSRMMLVEPGEAAREIFDAPGYFCNHMQACPTDSDLFSYDRWPAPFRHVPQAIHLCRVDGSGHVPAPLNDQALKPAEMWGVRDHYVWTPDGQRIVSYLFTHPMPEQEDFNHLTFEWRLSALDVKTGEDFCATYPEGRWGGHPQVTPDSRHVLCAGGPGFDYLYAVDIEQLRHGWNERILCAYPTTVSKGTNSDPFAMPFALPDGSGVIFNAGWPGETHGAYLVEWPAEL